jgi:hypothetical protein
MVTEHLAIQSFPCEIKAQITTTFGGLYVQYIASFLAGRGVGRAGGWVYWVR